MTERRRSGGDISLWSGLAETGGDVLRFFERQRFGGAPKNAVRIREHLLDDPPHSGPGKHNPSHLRPNPSHCPQSSKAVAVRQVHVDIGKIHVILLDVIDGLAPGRDARNIMTQFPHGVAEKIPHARILIHNKDIHGDTSIELDSVYIFYYRITQLHSFFSLIFFMKNLIKINSISIRPTVDKIDPSWYSG
jgi:hypothetical protein